LDEEATKYFPRARYMLVEPQDHLKAHIRDLPDGGYKIEWSLFKVKRPFLCKLELNGW